MAKTSTRKAPTKSPAISEAGASAPPPSATPAGPTPTAPRRGKKAAKIAGPKRPLSAYMYFVRERRPSLVKENPDIARQVTAVAKKLGEEWKQLKPEQKKPFEEQCAKDKERYQNEKAAI